MSETTTTIRIFDKLDDLLEGQSEIKQRLTKVEQIQSTKVDEIVFTRAINKTKNYINGKMKACFNKNHPADGGTKAKIDWTKTLRSSIFVFGASAGLGSGIATVILKVFG